MSASSIPAVLDALVSTLRTALGSTVTVFDGPPIEWNPLRLPGQSGVTGAEDQFKYLFVGATVAAEDSAQSVLDWNAAGNVSRDELLTIPCVVYTSLNTTDVKARRDEAFTILTAVQTAVQTTNPTLGGSILFGRLASVSVTQIQDDVGASVQVEFTIACKAYLS